MRFFFRNREHPKKMKKKQKKVEKEFGLDAVIVIESRAILIAD
ncbi:hypothetical protein [Microcoleus vaginatus]